MNNGYLLDTSVVSALAPSRSSLSPEVSAWLRANTGRVYLSAITITELEQGICKLRRAGRVERAERLTDWLDALLAGAGDRVLPFDSGVGRRAGALSGQAAAAGRHPGFPDIAIAATALAHELRLLTRNLRHFEPLGVTVSDPFLELPTESLP